jgi:FkbM family methyltransferase
MIRIEPSILQRFAAPSEELVARSPLWVNYLGVQTPSDFFPAHQFLPGARMSQIPFPDDMIHAGWTEYASLLYAIETAGDTLSVGELGAAWGPWVSAAGVVGRRLGRFSKIDLVAVEASPRKHLRLTQHLLENGLVDSDTMRVRPLSGAAWTQNDVLRFPSDESLSLEDIGAAVTKSEHDIRGHQMEMRDVAAFGFEDIFSGMDIVDLVHFDVQGAEEDIIPAWLEQLNQRVRIMLVGTHARHIEEKLFKVLTQAGWKLLHVTPCQYGYNPNATSIVGMTTRDGDYIWANPRLHNFDI